MTQSIHSDFLSYFTLGQGTCFQGTSFLNEIYWCQRCSRKISRFQIEKQVEITYNPLIVEEIKKEETSLFEESSKPKIQRVEPMNNSHNQIEKGSNTLISLRKLSYEQKEGRNSNSNLIRAFLRRVHSQTEESQDLVSRIIDKHKLKIQPSDYEKWFQGLEINSNKYIRVAVIRKLFRNLEQFKEEAIISRILFQHFLRNEALPSFLTSKKAKRGVMKHNLISIRTIWLIIASNRHP